MSIKKAMRSRLVNLPYFDPSRRVRTSSAQHDAPTLVCLHAPSNQALQLRSGQAPSRDKHRSWFISIIILTLFMFSCDLPHQPGPMPTEIVETEFEPGLNILGVLRADDQFGTSFININRTLTTEEIYSDSIENFAPSVDYVRVMSLSDSMSYNFSQSNVNASDWQDYNNTYLHANAGETYELEISAPGFPTLTGQTIIPDKSQLVANSLLIGSDKVSFQIQHHSSAFEYKLYLFFAEGILEKVLKPLTVNNLSVDWSFGIDDGAPYLLMISALDENLTRYGNSPISFIPNTFHPDGSTVSGGYGCFGSVSIALVEL